MDLPGDDQVQVLHKELVHLVAHNHVAAHAADHAIVHGVDHGEDREVAHEVAHVVDHGVDREVPVDVDRDVDEAVLAGKMQDSHEVPGHREVLEEDLVVVHRVLEAAHLDHP